MAGIDPKRQLLTLIRDYASEKSEGERRVIGLKKRIEELKSELESANAELQLSKHLKETTDQQLNGSKVELASAVALIQTLEARSAQIQDAISCIGSQVENLKNEERASRDEFIDHMVELSSRIRRFQETVASKFEKDSGDGTTAESDHEVAAEVVTEADSKTLEDLLAHVVSQTTEVEQEYLTEQNIQKQVQQEYNDLQRKVSLVGVIMKETKALQDLTRQTSELEQACACLGEELQKRCACPSCHADNVESLGGTLQANEAN